MHIVLSKDVCHTLAYDTENLFGALEQLGVEVELPDSGVEGKLPQLWGWAAVLVYIH